MSVVSRVLLALGASLCYENPAAQHAAVSCELLRASSARALLVSYALVQSLDLDSVVLEVVGPRRHGRRRRGRRGCGGGRAIVRGDRKGQRDGTAPAAAAFIFKRRARSCTSSRAAEGDRHGFSIAATGNQTSIYGACASRASRAGKEIRKPRNPPSKPAKPAKPRNRARPHTLPRETEPSKENTS